MRVAEAMTKRKTSADIVFEQLYESIMSLSLMPGEKVSEADIAERFGVSRQPVRDAFSRLGGMRLLQIQPQRATQVRKFSLSAIADARFVRLALELEIMREAAANWDDKHADALERNLGQQEEAVATLDRSAFHRLDERFHQLLAKAAGRANAFELVLQKKAMVDRICVLSLKDQSGMEELVADHRAILRHVADGDIAGLERFLRLHLSRIEATIATIRKSHEEYFEL